ncbi:hypothetical protein IJJ97_06280 [bacterium]|nr:hypothetical protein [bacterium]
MEDIKKRNTRQRNWRKENMTEIRAYFHNRNDAEIIELLKSSKNKTDVIRQALKQYIENHKEA